jgi:predicted ABC-type ATPase
VRALDAKTRLAEADELRSPAAADLDRRLDRLPDGHPSSPRYASDKRDADDVRPLTDAEHADHVADVKVRLAEAREAGLATYLQHTVDDRHEVWSYERRVLHDDLVQSLYSMASAAPCDNRAVVAGGLAGAGKSTVLTEHAGIDRSAYLVINPDLIKAEMARRELVPHVEGLTPMETAELVHEETSHIAARLGRRAEADGKNIIWDITMSRPESGLDRLTALRAAGYTRVEGVFVDIPIDVSLRRVDARHRMGHDEFRVGIGLGGRFVPRELTLAQADTDWSSKNRASFEQLKHRFDAWTRYDNAVDGRAPVLADAGGPPTIEGRPL